MIDLSGGISNPLIEAGIVVGVGAVALIFRRWRTCGVLCTMALAWALLCATPAFSLLLWHGLAHQYPPQPPTAYPRADAIVLVGGGPVPRFLDQWNAKANPGLTTSLGFALALYRAGKAPVLVTTGNYGDGAATRALIRGGVPAGNLDMNPTTRSTHEDATHSRQSMRFDPGNTILLVATGIHMPRTATTFRRQGFRVIPAPAYHRAWITHLPHAAWWPRRAALYLSRSCLHEYIGLFYYRLRGWAVW